eukprot:TRINITY_DN17629_c0_g1_i1.p1 TRINITY_DN17629_c0_g1~~TRINITY_DN17629_c0_g1_i1.p1  ORF type:complete len:194 (-),score=34.27 TRINITY_DN17629_c0_g1_i1:160-741(-)
MTKKEKNSTQKLRKDLLKCVNNESFSDVKIIINGTEFFCHCCVLSRSNTLALCFSNSMKEGRTKVMEINDIDTEIFKSFLQYLYSDYVNIPSLTHALDLLRCADRFLVQPLKNICGQYVIDSDDNSNGLLNHNNVLTILEIADQCSLLELRKVAVHYVAKNFHAVCKQMALKKLHKDILIEIIQTHASFCTNN